MADNPSSDLNRDGGPEADVAQNVPAPKKDLPPTTVRARLWPVVIIVGCLWIACVEAAIRDPGSTRHFFSMALAPLLAATAMFIWLMLASRIPWRDRFLGLGVVIVTLIGVFLLIHPSLKGGVLFYVLPTLLTVIAVGLVVLAPLEWPRRKKLLGCGILLTSCTWLLLRMDGMDGSMNTDFSWRWAKTAEEAFLASSDATANAPATTLAVPDTAQPGDWPEFRGVQRDGVVSGVTFGTDWKKYPPEELWRRKIGPGWSSFTVIDPYLFTQEQRGEKEVVVCYHAETGEFCWVNEVDCRYVDQTAASGAGPRATPTFSDGQLFTMGATGQVQCLDASTGKTIWSRSAVKDTKAKAQLWGCSSSPLVIDDVVIVFAGGPDGKGVVGYDRTDGTMLWTSGRGTLSYSSPHRLSAGENTYVLMLSEIGLEVFEPTKGQLIWDYDWKSEGMRIIQPTVVDNDHLIIAEDYTAARMIRVLRDSGDWKSEELWSSRDLKPYFNDFVYHNGHCYGFDGKIFTCVDAATGKRIWKGGRYGFGQVLLISDMNALLVLSEKGKVVLLEASPDGHKELGSFQAITGKTWNHPVIAHGKLFVRNDQEAACFLVGGRK